MQPVNAVLRVQLVIFRLENVEKINICQSVFSRNILKMIIDADYFRVPACIVDTVIRGQYTLDIDPRTRGRLPP